MSNLPSAAEIRRELQSLPAVVHALVDGGPPWRVCLVCDDAEAARAAEPAAVTALGRLGIGGADTEIGVACLVSAPARRRVRLVEAALLRPSAGSAGARVAVEWEGAEYGGEATGEGGPGGEQRVCVLATLAAVRAAAPGSPAVELVGIRSVRVFDRELLVVLLRTPDREALVGSVIVADGVPTAAARATLNALNRTLGAYLLVPD